MEGFSLWRKGIGRGNWTTEEAIGAIEAAVVGVVGMMAGKGENDTCMFESKAKFVAQAAIIAAVYTVLKVFIAAFNLASGAIQVRVSEALTILPVFTPAAVPGLFIGCLISNTVTGAAPLDIVFGSIATLIGAFGTYRLRSGSRILASIPPIVANVLIIPFVLSWVYQIPGSIPFFMLTVGVGEVISCLVLGQMLYSALTPVKRFMFIQ